jgi:dihydropteroate synthase
VDRDLRPELGDDRLDHLLKTAGAVLPHALASLAGRCRRAPTTAAGEGERPSSVSCSRRDQETVAAGADILRHALNPRRPKPLASRPVVRSRYDELMTGERFVWRAGPHVLHCGARTHVMGVINVTPDSFSDGGRHFDPEVAVASGIDMVRAGADLLDVGGESTRPGAEEVAVEVEIDRVVPVVKRLTAEVDVPISIDTRKHQVAEAALGAGASIVNDVAAGEFDPQMLPTVGRLDAGLVLMHMRGTPATMQGLVEYDDVVVEVKRYLLGRLQAAVDAGIDRERVAIDPGLGFAKTTPQSLLLMRDVAAFLELERPVLVGPSRKSFIGHVLGTDVTERAEGTSGAVAWLAAQGAHVVRVHDVRQMVRVVRVVDAIRTAAPDEQARA